MIMKCTKRKSVGCTAIHVDKTTAPQEVEDFLLDSIASKVRYHATGCGEYVFNFEIPHEFDALSERSIMYIPDDVRHSDFYVVSTDYDIFTLSPERFHVLFEIIED